MNLIKKTLFAVFLLQLFGFIYIKIFHKKSIKTIIAEPSTITHVENNTHINHLIETTSIESLKKQKIKEKITLPKKTSQKKISKKTYNSNSKVEKYAKKFLGHKYVWGATGPKTFDCSGFTQKVYRQSTGINIPRVSKEQAKVGKYIKFANLKKGDMVFFDTTKKRLGKVNHVGIYLSKGNFIHASSGGKKVMITNFRKKKFYKNRFLWGRRITQEHTTVVTITHKKDKKES